MSIYLHDWAEGGEAQMLSDFGIKKGALTDAEVLVASYTYEDYSGDAFVLFRRGGELFEVNGAHCSCYGLESGDIIGGGASQWEPEPTTAESLFVRHFDPDVAAAVHTSLASQDTAS